MLAMLQVLNNHLRLVATMVDRADTEHFHHEKVLLDRAAFEDSSRIS